MVDKTTALALCVTLATACSHMAPEDHAINDDGFYVDAEVEALGPDGGSDADGGSEPCDPDDESYIADTGARSAMWCEVEYFCCATPHVDGQHYNAIACPGYCDNRRVGGVPMMRPTSGVGSAVVCMPDLGQCDLPQEHDCDAG